MSGRPSQDASAVLKGAPLAPLRFLHAHSCLVASSFIEGMGPDKLSSDYWTTWVSGPSICAKRPRRRVSDRGPSPNRLQRTGERYVGRAMVEPTPAWSKFAP